MWGATCVCNQEGHKAQISIHAPRVGSDITILFGDNIQNDFNPRSPCGERLGRETNSPESTLFQSTLPVWGATLTDVPSALAVDISIHAPRVGSDQSSFTKRARERNFNPRSPCGERPRRTPKPCNKKLFQSTLPVWGATFLGTKCLRSRFRFQSTLPVWGATARQTLRITMLITISIHAPRVGSDRGLRA